MVNPVFSPILITLKIAFIATIFSFLIGVSLAYLLNKKKVPGKDIWETLLTLPMILPPSTLGYLLLIVFGQRGFIGSFLDEHFGIQIVFTQAGAIIAACIVSMPLMYQSVKSAFQHIDPVYEKAARTLGSSEWKVFRTILLPMAWPGIVSGIVLSFARAVGEFGATLMIAGNIPGQTQTISLAIYYAVENGNTELANTLVAFMTIFSFVLIFSLNAWLKKKDFNIDKR